MAHSRVAPAGEVGETALLSPHRGVIRFAAPKGTSFGRRRRGGYGGKGGWLDGFQLAVLGDMAVILCASFQGSTERRVGGVHVYRFCRTDSLTMIM